MVSDLQVAGWFTLNENKGYEETRAHQSVWESSSMLIIIKYGTDEFKDERTNIFQNRPCVPDGVIISGMIEKIYYIVLND